MNTARWQSASSSTMLFLYIKSGLKKNLEGQKVLYLLFSDTSWGLYHRVFKS
jgi:hypothetical protein